MTMDIRRASEADVSREYNCDLRRLMPWSKVADGTPWGAAVATVHPGDATTAHAHDEDEVFLILQGRGRLTIGEEEQELSTGDLVSIPRGVRHTMRNHTEASLQFLSVYWGEKPEYFDAVGDA